jgi:G3E family GTPase
MQPGTERLAAAWDSLLFTLGGPPAESTHHRPRPSEKIPVTVLGGFLGAGKTTLLCQILEESTVEIVAIVNDIASVNVDAVRVRSRNAETIELDNGCVCCVLGDNLRETLEEIGERSRRPEALVIETSGLSDPVGVAQTVANVESVSLDGIVTVVDALTFRERARDPMTAHLFARQLTAAHLVVLTKTASAGDAFDLREEVGQHVPGRPVLLSDHGETGAEVLLGAALRGARPATNAATHVPGGFAVETLEWTQPVVAKRFFEILDELPETVYRAKGWVWLDEASKIAEPAECFDVQAAGPHWRVARRDGPDRTSQLVVIGKAGNRGFDAFVRKLRGLRMTSTNDAAR